MARKQYTIHFIYRITCNLNGKYYIGMHSTFNLEDGYMGSGKRIRYSINKHGIENHTREILEFLPDRSSLKIREREIVNRELIKEDQCMNIMEGGDGGFISDEQQKRRSEAATTAVWKKRRNDPEMMKRFKERASKNIKQLHIEGKVKVPNWKGRRHKQETKDKVGEKNSIRQRGTGNSNFGKCWIFNEEQMICKSVKKDEIETYLLIGWFKGRKRF
jgi:hypothetical protein